MAEVKKLYGIKLDRQALPNHVAIIMDGNGRWAQKRGLDRVRGHEVGYQVLKDIIESNRDIGVPFISVYAFSTENWSRPQAEVEFLMSLARTLVTEYTETLIKNDIRLWVTGTEENVSPELLTLLNDSVARTAHCKTYTLNIAFNYGGKRELLDAMKKLASEVQAGRLKPADISEADIARCFYHPDLPEVDLLIRTSGEQRISNFFLWQSAYSEFYFTPVLWPDFKPRQFCLALAEYQKRQRRFGGLS